MDGIEIVVTPRTLERFAFGVVIAILLVLLVLKWGGGSCDVPKNETAVAAAETLQAANVAAAPDTSAETAKVTESEDICANGAKDSGETDVDCGGPCDACAEFKTCNIDADCSEGLSCFQHLKCLKPSCDDGMKNQDETAVDCGGECGGYFWSSDSTCHDEKEPSGELEVNSDIEIGKSPNSGSAIIESITLTVDNGMTKSVDLEATVYVRTAKGEPIFENKEGEISIATQTMSVGTGKSVTKSIDLVNNTRTTLAGIKSTDKFQIVIDFEDVVKHTMLKEYTWINE